MLKLENYHSYVTAAEETLVLSPSQEALIISGTEGV